MKTVIEMAIEAELIYNEEGWCGWVEDTDLRPFIERFAELVRAEERDACAKLCEAQNNKAVVRHPARVEFDPDSMMAKKCAAAIRARGETK